MPSALIIVYKSPNGRDGWEPVKQEDVPEWVADPTNMANMLEGYMANDPTQGEAGSDWWRAERVAHPTVQ